MSVIPFTGGRNTDAKNAIANFYDDKGVSTFGHRKNMLAPFITKIGIGVSYDSANKYLWIAMTFSDDEDTNLNPGRFEEINLYTDYCNKNGIDNIKYPSHYDMADKEYWAVYDENGVSFQNIADEKFGPNTKTPSNPFGTESGAPDDVVMPPVTPTKPSKPITPTKPVQPTKPVTTPVTPSDPDTTTPTKPADNSGKDDAGQVIADNGSTADIIHNDETSSTTTTPAGSIIATHQVMPGVVTVNRTISSLYNREGKLVVDRALIKGSSWSTNMQIMVNGTVYYQVSTNEFIKADEVNYYPKGLNNYARISAKQILIDNIPNNVVKLTAGTKLWNLAPDGKSMNIEVDRYLALNSRWLTDKSLYIGGVTFYRVSSNEWIPAGFGYLEK
ncbi:hypothetical protein DS831_06420 [Bombilactobacillus bombi]|uniref:Uncharacterized protein n=1 Tax=Bombilactobacillus bombi TaxID=1303590 RepID=A0A417ZEX6_9LACO|nr:SLAP domain-containing protein [Bombilactobacillus bombi]RHW49795.1 hypothetical protein DS831_06420 [Bombilactobacillus bombi]